MTTSPADRPTPRRRFGTALLLTLLCACGGGGGDKADGEPRKLLSTEQDSVAPTVLCDGPPPTYTNEVLTGAWSALRAALAGDGVTFPESEGNVAVDTVALCIGCKVTRVKLQSSNFTPCLQPGHLGGTPRILGQMVLLDSFPAQKGFPAIPRNDTIFTFAHAPSGPALLIYRNGTQAARAFSPLWNFHYCDDPHTPVAGPEAQWRTTASTTQNDPGGTYGWMACASGCCQYYIKPPATLPEEAVEHAQGHLPDSLPPGRRFVTPPCPGT